MGRKDPIESAQGDQARDRPARDVPAGGGEVEWGNLLKRKLPEGRQGEEAPEPGPGN